MRDTVMIEDASMSMRRFHVELMPVGKAPHGHSYGVFAHHEDHAVEVVMANAFEPGRPRPLVAFSVAMNTPDELEKATTVPPPPVDPVVEVGFWFPPSLAGPAVRQSRDSKPGTWARAAAAYANPASPESWKPTELVGHPPGSHLVILDRSGAPRTDWLTGTYAPHFNAGDEVRREVLSAKYGFDADVVEIEYLVEGEHRPFSPSDLAIDFLSGFRSASSTTSRDTLREIRVDAGTVRAAAVKDDRVIAFVWEGDGRYFLVKVVSGDIDLRGFDYGIGTWETGPAAASEE